MSVCVCVVFVAVAVVCVCVCVFVCVCANVHSFVHTYFCACVCEQPALIVASKSHLVNGFFLPMYAYTLVCAYMRNMYIPFWIKITDRKSCVCIHV